VRLRKNVAQRRSRASSEAQIGKIDGVLTIANLQHNPRSRAAQIGGFFFFLLWLGPPEIESKLRPL
jgi:hypothetical protein